MVVAFLRLLPSKYPIMVADGVRKARRNVESVNDRIFRDAVGWCVEISPPRYSFLSFQRVDELTNGLVESKAGSHIQRVGRNTATVVGVLSKSLRISEQARVAESVSEMVGEAGTPSRMFPSDFSAHHQPSTTGKRSPGMNR